LNLFAELKTNVIIASRVQQRRNIMEELVRVYIQSLDEQFVYHMENTEKNIANFIYEYATDENTIMVNNIFGRQILGYNKREQGFIGKERDTKKVEEYLQNLLLGKVKAEKAEIIHIVPNTEKEDYILHDMDEKSFEGFVF
jgi:hypothetical protein